MRRRLVDALLGRVFRPWGAEGRDEAWKALLRVTYSGTRRPDGTMVPYSVTTQEAYRYALEDTAAAPDSQEAPP